MVSPRSERRPWAGRAESADHSSGTWLCPREGGPGGGGTPIGPRQQVPAGGLRPEAHHAPASSSPPNQAQEAGSLWTLEQGPWRTLVAQPDSDLHTACFQASVPPPAASLGKTASS